MILQVIETIRKVYSPFGQPTDTLVTKVLLGTFGCLPACDRYFIDGFKSQEFSYSYVNEPFIKRVLHFCRSNVDDLRVEQRRIEGDSGVRYPLMKSVDMYFWQFGFDAAAREAASSLAGVGGNFGRRATERALVEPNG